ncbi:hypothetical protein B0I75DRAFT_157292 [Yarrowia lipolytica]|nr:hypothetical protein B0I74DRAFT_172414 [Yarrowia lipolytica]RDW53933.1 hypothetical protein B0I75DRAFT_157292 [Yarrowia lipolytica]
MCSMVCISVIYGICSQSLVGSSPITLSRIVQKQSDTVVDPSGTQLPAHYQTSKSPISITGLEDTMQFVVATVSSLKLELPEQEPEQESEQDDFKSLQSLITR